MPRCLSASGGALDKALFNKERLIHFLDGAGVFTYSGGDGSDTHGPSVEFVDDGEEDFVVHFVEAEAVDVEIGRASCRERV